VIFSHHLRRSSLYSPLSVDRKPLPLTSLAAPYPLTPIESHRYKNHGGRGAPPVFPSLLARSFRSLHQERFTTLLSSNGSTLFLKTAGCHPTIPILELAFILGDRLSFFSSTYKCPLPQLPSFDILTNAWGTSFQRFNVLTFQRSNVQRSVACRLVSERSTIGCLHIEEGTRHGHR